MNPQDIRAATIVKRRSVRVENIAVRISDIELNEDTPSYFVGNRIDTNEAVRIRLMTVAEAVDANKRKDANEGDIQRLSNYYTERFATGTNVRPTAEAFADKNNKVHVQPGGVVMFERALPNDDGTLRAQWANTIAPSPNDEVLHAVVHLDARKENPSAQQKAVVRATIVNPDAAVALDKDNRLDVLYAMMMGKDTKGNPRSPAPVLRMMFNDGTMEHVTVPAMTETHTRKDPNTGLDKRISRMLEPQAAIDAILNSEAMANTKNGKLTKAILSGLTGKEANWGAMPEPAKNTMKALAQSIASGDTPVIAIPGQRINAGPQAAAAMLRQADRPNSPASKLLNSVETREIQVNNEPVKLTTPTYTEAVVSILRHRDTKAPFLRDVFTVSPWPKFEPLSKLELGENAKLATAEMAEPSDDLNGEQPSDMPLDMGLSDSDIDQGLQQATQNMDDGPDFGM